MNKFNAQLCVQMMISALMQIRSTREPLYGIAFMNIAA